MMILRTKRLDVIPLNPQQFGLYLECRGDVSGRLGFVPSPGHPDEGFLEAMQGLYGLSLASPADYLWLTNWQMVLRGQNLSVGSLCFHSVPSARTGRVEIGYGVDEEYRGMGFAPEAVEAVCLWALAQPGVGAVIAETDPDNTPSKRVLEKCGFRPEEELGENVWVRDGNVNVKTTRK